MHDERRSQKRSLLFLECYIRKAVEVRLCCLHVTWRDQRAMNIHGVTHVGRCETLGVMKIRTSRAVHLRCREKGLAGGPCLCNMDLECLKTEERALRLLLTSCQDAGKGGSRDLGWSSNREGRRPAGPCMAMLILIAHPVVEPVNWQVSKVSLQPFSDGELIAALKQ
ncbi:hypothetical protein G7K_5963-t1 [Saitoella complicata NRRL Y-17804]|uniref:Uncharacterized protein n=1 Tax=Saitoella complicata (strain BCRC 22490 / CBS 7301 / JCM 7358 / NBRC 10748 / NRRL Y-17804) TaxID=698492 RepID=A0A0E9NPU1_SAICN|nr:hypothetical protein G7K_5963-t1 [Saitoella complicata NRRL Y-17804]